MINIHAAIELFHLLFLHQLGSKLDKNLYALKGGCNLRFFFKSIRYSEDIDLDVTTIASATLENKVNKIINSIDFKRILQSKGIEIVQANAAKQTQTTQRWKFLLRTANSTIALPTKIEFSRRKMDKGVVYEAIDTQIISSHHLYPILCNHYNAEAAFIQKIDALINRTQTQARDIFDLHWFIDQSVNFKATVFTKEQLLSAISNIQQVHYEDFKGQVIAFLMEEYKDFYGAKSKWQKIQEQVIAVLKGG